MAINDKELHVMHMVKAKSEIHLILKNVYGHMNLHVFTESDIEKSMRFIKSMSELYKDGETRILLKDYHPIPKFVTDDSVMPTLQAYLYKTEIMKEAIPGILSYLYDHDIKDRATVKSIYAFLNAGNKIYKLEIV